MRRVVLLLLAVVLVTSQFIYQGEEGTAQANTQFPDLGTSGRVEVKTLVDQSIITGFPDGSFRPNTHVTRAQAVTMIARALQLDEGMEDESSVFRDVPANHFAINYINLAVEKGIVSGFEDGTFRPEQPVTRGQMAIFLARAFQLTETSNQTYSDVHSWTLGAAEINRITGARISAGYPDGTFRPNQATTRLEFSLFLARTIEPAFRLSVQQITDQKGATLHRATVVNAPNGLNVRPTPSTNNTPLGRISNGTVVEYTTTTNGWVEINYGGQIGYVSLQFLSLVGSGESEVQKGSLEGVTIVIDPGHGGRDPGATAYGVSEKNVVLAVGLKLEKKLKDAGVNVIMTRKTDTFLELSERVAIARQHNADSFISIHANAAGSEAAHGTETYWNRTASDKESKELAEKIQKHLIATLKTRDRGVKEGNFHVIRETRMPSVLVELGFITNRSEAQRMSTNTFHEEAAEAIYKGIVEFYQ
ncbi:N-acetylmuramoyl-L-alanine amidase [Bacillus sp. FJAT-45350]|uniref:N-acetylmuramoyl-L-alanine amidase n=1 Tax=Bacillus sp. FJAT-45350 TaxID=2011014 RepID=UPI000BB7FF87|nr:N-acetylmuramoyl-L-alanine amidase [Bacillus sp. FJAT-45350]